VETTAAVHRTQCFEQLGLLGLFRFWADRLICSRLPIFRFFLHQLIELIVFVGTLGTAGARP